MLKQKYFLVPLGILCAMLLTERAQGTVRFPRQFIDDSGYTVIIPKKPERIISLSPAITEILFAIGAGNEVVGVTTYCDFPPQATKLDKVGGFSTPSIEVIVNKKPDLIITSYGKGDEAIRKLRELGLGVMYLRSDSLKGILQNIGTIGKATGHEEEAEKLIQKLEYRIHLVKEKGSRIPEEEKPRILWLMWYPELWTAGARTFFDEFVHLAGADNVAHDLEGWKMISMEIVVARQPQIIFCSRMGKKQGFLEKVMQDPHLEQTEAVKSGCVFELYQDVIERPGPRIVEGLEKISHYIEEWWRKRTVG